MSSTRARLTAAYAGLLIGTMVASGTALWFARKESADQQLAHQAQAMAERVLAVIRRAQAEGKTLTYRESSGTGPTIQATRQLGELLDPRPGFFLVIDSTGKQLYSSPTVRLLTPDDQQRILQVADSLRADYVAKVPISGDTLFESRVLLAARRDPSVGPDIARVVAGLPTDAADLAPQLLIGSMLALSPIVLVFSLGAAYLVAGHVLRPVERLINDVEAITDGRSLHRRLPADHSNDEIARLTATLNAMLARLEHSFGALRRFTADASHELKTPLTVLRADVERAMHPSTSRSDRMVALEEALQETARMADLVDSLLTLARADEGRFDLHRSPIELEPLVQEVLETATILGEDSGLAIEVPTLENGVVLGDRTRLRQLFLNLLTNAIKYTPRGGRVDISLTRRPHDEIAFVVRDTGIGISANDLPHIFERFWRADRARSRASERGGFGLGLSIAQWIVQAHGGSLTVASRLGRGSIFTVVLPLAGSALAAPSEDTDAPTRPIEAPALGAGSASVSEES
jgi:two-component system OmpR family sensor kinase